jgi:antitoxin component of RelBE/YafQ-DinJ toxin-antitoxin module
VRPPIRDPLQRRKNVLLRGDRQVIEAADALAKRYGVSRNDALNAILRAFVQDSQAPERLGMLLAATVAAAGAAAAEAYRQEASR